MYLYVIVEILRQFQSWRHHTIRRMVDLNLELCLRFVLWEDFLVEKFDTLMSIQNYFVVEEHHKIILDINAIYKHINSKNLPSKSSWIFFLIGVGWSFQTASNCDFKGVIVVFSIMCPRTFTWVKKKTRFIWCCFHTFFIKVWWYLSSTLDFFILFVTAWKHRLKMYLHFCYELLV